MGNCVLPQLLVHVEPACQVKRSQQISGITFSVGHLIKTAEKGLKIWRWGSHFLKGGCETEFFLVDGVIFLAPRYSYVFRLTVISIFPLLFSCFQMLKITSSLRYILVSSMEQMAEFVTTCSRRSHQNIYIYCTSLISLVTYKHMMSVWTGT